MHCAVLCTVLCCAVLCCALCCAVLCCAVCDALEEEAGQWLLAPHPRPRGGFFVWLALRPGLEAARVHLRLLANGVMAGLGEHYFGPGEHDHGSGSGQPQHIRLAFIGCTEDELLEAAKRIRVSCAEAANEQALVTTVSEVARL
jgi:DNA-binding transcriptional MocR family regulator